MLSAYITNLGKYNEGYLIGEWVNLPVDPDELQQVFCRIGLDYTTEDGQKIRTGYEEYFITDYEHEDLPDLNLGEYESITRLNKLAEKLKKVIYPDILAAALELDSDVDDILDNLDDYVLSPEISNDADLGYYWLYGSGCYDIPKFLYNYTDNEAFGRSIRLNEGGEYTNYGYIMRIY